MTAKVAERGIGDNSAAVGEMLAEKPELIFTDRDMLPALLDSLEREIAAHKPDVSTKKGRDAIAKLARSMATTKTKYDELGKRLNEDHRKAINVVDEVRRDLRDKLDKLRDKARAPLDEWEQIEESRQNRINEVRTKFADMARPPADATVEQLEKAIAYVEVIEVDPELFGDLTASAEAERKIAIKGLSVALERLRQAEKDRADLARMRAEKEEADRVAREAAAKAAAEKADQERIAAASKRAAEEAIEAERKKVREAEAEAERVRAAERQKALDAEAAAQKVRDAEKAKTDAAAAEERRQAQAAIDEANRKARAAEEALEAQRREEAAKVAEAARVQAQKDAADAARQRDQDHRSKVMRAAKEAIMEHGKVDEGAAKRIVLAIAAKSIPSVEIAF